MQLEPISEGIKKLVDQLDLDNYSTAAIYVLNIIAASTYILVKKRDHNKVTFVFENSYSDLNCVTISLDILESNQTRDTGEISVIVDYLKEKSS